MSNPLLEKLATKAVENIERITLPQLTEASSPDGLLRPHRDPLISERLTPQLTEETALREAEMKLVEIRGWMERREINPLYRWRKAYRTNCGTCAFALWRRLNGDDPDAVATSTNVAPHPEDMELITRGLKMENTSPEEIEQILRARGPGSHLIVGITRFDGRPGHWFNAYFDGTTVWTLDAQRGAVWEWPHNYGNIKSWEVLL